MKSLQFQRQISARIDGARIKIKEASVAISYIGTDLMNSTMPSDPKEFLETKRNIDQELVSLEQFIKDQTSHLWSIRNRFNQRSSR